MKPTNRKELFLAALAGADVTPPEPVTREERYYAAMLGMCEPPAPPANREEMYLSAIVRNAGNSGNSGWNDDDFVPSYPDSFPVEGNEP